MLGYWLEGAPVTTNHPRVLATTYIRPDAILIALASWSEEDEVVSLSADWDALGFGGEEGHGAYAPAVEGLQEIVDVDLSAVRLPAGQGLFVVFPPPRRPSSDPFEPRPGHRHAAATEGTCDVGEEDPQGLRGRDTVRADPGMGTPLAKPHVGGMGKSEFMKFALIRLDGLVNVDS
jgi:hypothetical protein